MTRTWPCVSVISISAENESCLELPGVTPVKVGDDVTLVVTLYVFVLRFALPLRSLDGAAEDAVMTSSTAGVWPVVPSPTTPVISPPVVDRPDIVVTVASWPTVTLRHKFNTSKTCQTSRNKKAYH